MKKNKSKQQAPKLKQIDHEKIAQLVESVKTNSLDEADIALVIDVLNGNCWLIQEVLNGHLTIAKLRKMIFDNGTESLRNRRQKSNPPVDDAPDEGTTPEEDTPPANNHNKKKKKDSSDEDNSPPKKGHGRLKAGDYQGALVVNVELDALSPGDPCPQADSGCTGRLYAIEPGVLLRVTGGPPIQATRYELEKLRCNVCGELVTAQVPEGVSPKKYDESCVALLMINRYFMSVPMYRQEGLQAYLGVPMPSSTQWDLISAHQEMFETLYLAFLQDAAQANGICVDDTRAVVLEQLSKNRQAVDKKSKKACYTTGFVSVHDDHLSYIFLTNNQSAGKDLAPIMDLRDRELPHPFLMCDALTANIPKGIDSDLYLLCYCLAHARRQFYELPPGYDDFAERVLLLINTVYKHDAATKSLSASQRLAYHQVHSTPVMAELKDYLTWQAEEFEPNSSAGKAIQYCLKRWTQLSQFLRHAGVPIDNNITEQALKLVIQTRKSSMFYKTLDSARIASTIQTALYSAAQNDINPFDYIKTLLVHEPAVLANPSAWLPWCYQSTLAELEDGKARHDGLSIIRP